MAGGRIEVLVEPDLRGFPGKLEAGLKSSSGLASTLGRGLGLAIVAGTAVAAVGLKSVITLGVEYQNQLNTLQSVTQATGVQMAQVGTLAKQLGADLSLPATSAADAAAAMTELAKGGLSVEEAMTAAKGTLQLAAAAQIEAAQAAEIQSDALNQFGLEASEAGHVADLLANTANAASGEITDMANALKFVGPVAKSVGENIDNVSTAIGVLAVNGIRGEQAGTSLRGMIASLSAPSGPASKALETLGVKAFDATGKFVGLRAITGQLAEAKGRLSEAAFAEAAAIAFGNEGLTTATALAASGVGAFDDMASAVTRAGGAADVAAAKAKGLGGAWQGLKSQLETAGIEIFEAIDGPLEGLVRSASTFVEDFGGKVADGIEDAVTAGQTFGPLLADAIKSRASVVGAAVEDVFGPLAESSVGVLNSALNAGIGLWNDFTGVLGNAVDAAQPVANGIAAVADAANEADGPVSAVAAGIGLAGDAAGAASSLLIPLGAIVGGIANGFAALPGPVQSAAIALGLVAAFKGPLSSLGDTVRDRVTTPFRNLGETIRLQSALLTGSTQIASQEVGKLGLAFSALEKHVPVIGRMADSYRGAAESARTFVTQQSALLQASSGISNQYTGLATALGRSEGALRTLGGAAAGTAAALGTGLKSAASGLVSFFGGPWGVALAAAAVGLSLLAKSQQEAAQKAAEHKRNLSDLQGTLDQTTGAVTRQTREYLAQKNASDGVNDAAKRQKVALDSLVDAQSGNADALAKFNTELRNNAREYVTSSHAAQALQSGLKSAGISFEDLTEVAVGNQDALKKVQAAIAAVGGKGAGALKDFLKDLQNGTADFAKLGGAVGGANDDLKEVAKNVADARAALGDSSPFVVGLAASMGVLSSSTASAAEKASALKRALDFLSGGQVGLTAAQAAFNDALQRANDALGAGIDRAKGYGDGIIDASGKLNVATENGRSFQRAADDLTSSLLNVATATFDVSKGAGDTLPQSFEKVKQSVQASRDGLIDLAVNGYGVSREAAERYADQLGLIPEIVATQVTTNGSAPAATKEVNDVLLELRGLPPNTPVTVDALTETAQKLLADLGFRIVSLPDGRFEVHANTSPAESAADDVVRRINGKVATIQINTVYGGLTGPNIPSHDGNIISAMRYASGGVHRKLTPMRAGLAQIVPPNTWRVVGDRLRDDEFYIPDNDDIRSMQLGAEWARRRGLALVRTFAQGGIAASSKQMASSVPGVNTFQITINAPGATPEGVRMLNRETLPQLRRMLHQEVGKRR